ncbi:MAG: glycoside hydrolase family 5 protein [Clostridiales bacterium]|nr:glycoside hydrolase family 5 protein [Candidatus Blautia equi]
MKKEWLKKMAIGLGICLTLGAGAGSVSAAVEAAGTQQEFEIPDTESFQFVRDMKIGWNLGNTFDASDCSWLKNDLDYESGWCGVKTTPELTASIKEAGFNTIRMPVSWHNHLSDEANYTVNEAWMNRVQEVVDYCMDQDLYVILNIHHDNSKDYMYPDQAHMEQSMKYVTSIWTQVAERFADYDEKLLFESLNEPRLVGHTNEWWINPSNPDCKESILCINELNQAFVDLVRASGGNNASRYLVIPGYDASPDGATNANYVFPTDIPENDHRIIQSIHAYTPYPFALEMPGVDSWKSSNLKDYKDMTTFMDKIYKTFVANEIPVIIDEFGAMEKNGNLEARVDFAGTYISEAKQRGITCVWWDNNVSSGNGERFGLIDRKTLTWEFPEIVDAMMEAAE